MNPLEELKVEHRAIEAALDTFLRIADRLVEHPDTETVEDAQEMTDFFRTFTDTCHHGKEEGHLFPAMEAAGVPREGGPIGAMLHEHEEGRLHMRNLQQALDGCRTGASGAADAFRLHAAGYRDFLLRHIDKEDNVLFPMAADRLSTDTLNTLSRAFDRWENEKIGPGRHEELHRMLEAFEAKYGGK